jgi:hypothetical protein
VGSRCVASKDNFCQNVPRENAFFDNFFYTTYNFQLVNHLLPHCRPPCIKASSYSTAQAEEVTPVQVAPKAKQGKRLQNFVLDDRGFPDQSNDYSHVLHSIDGGPILRKLKHPVLDLNAPVDPAFYSEFIPEKHTA